MLTKKEKIIVTSIYGLFTAFPFVMLFYGNYIVDFLFSILEWIIAIVALILITIFYGGFLIGRPALILYTIYYCIKNKNKNN